MWSDRKFRRIAFVCSSRGNGDANDIPVLAMPYPILDATLGGACDALFLRICWHRALHNIRSNRDADTVFEGPLPGCPAADAAVWKRAGRNSAEPPGTRDALKFDASTCGDYVNKLRSCAAAMRAHPESMPGSTQQDICGVIDGLQEWRFQLLGVYYTTGIPKFRHTSLQLLQCI